MVIYWSQTTGMVELSEDLPLYANWMHSRQRHCHSSISYNHLNRCEEPLSYILWLDLLNLDPSLCSLILWVFLFLVKYIKLDHPSPSRPNRSFFPSKSSCGAQHEFWVSILGNDRKSIFPALYMVSFLSISSYSRFILVVCYNF